MQMTAGLLFQIIWAGFVVIATVFFAWYFSRNTVFKFNGKPPSTRIQKMTKMALLFFISTVLLLVGHRLTASFFHTSSFFVVVVRVLFFAAVYGIVKEVTGKRDLGIGAALLAILYWTLHHFGRLSEIRDFSNQFSVSLGHVRVTPLWCLKAIFVAVSLYWLVSLGRNLAHAEIGKQKKIAANIKAALNNLFDVLISVLAVIIGLKILGIDLTIFAVFSGALGVGLGFGLQKIVANYVSGVVLLVEGTIKEGDLVGLADVTGYVRKFGIRSVLIEASDGREITVPNDEFITNRVTNWTLSNRRGLVEIKMILSYKIDLVLAQSLALEVATAHPKCLASPAPVCLISEFSENTVTLLLRVFMEDVTQGRAQLQSDIMQAVWKAFKQKEIGLPFSQPEK